jgi:serine/threonine protein kinase
MSDIIKTDTVDKIIKVDEKINNIKNISLEDKYNLICSIGSGSFGEVFLATNKYNKNKSYAIKIEKRNSSSRLKEEHEFYKKLHKRGVVDGLPKIYDFFETKKANMLVMQLLGDSLDILLDKNGGTFDLGTVFKLGIDMVNLLRDIHKAGFIHRDIKPNNFLVGCDSKRSKLYAIDFGLSKQYVSHKKHISFRVERSLVGTARYASINVHMGLEPSRRDDLESVGYMLIYFIRGKLPWQGLKKDKNTDHIQLIGNVKMYTGLKKLCNDVPYCFIEYIDYCKKLTFDEEPDYSFLTNLFINSAKDNNIELKYCWI